MTRISLPRSITNPEVLIEVEGIVRPELNSSLKTLLVEDAVDTPPRCEVCLSNWGSSGDEVTYLYFDRTVLDFGKALAVQIGSKEEIFRGFISAIEGRFGGDEPPSIIVHAEGALAALHTPRRTRTFENINDASVFRQIAAENGLQAVIDVQDITHEVLAQLNQSDLAFIRERASWLNAEVWLQDSQLYVVSRTTRTANANEVHVALGRGLQEFKVTADIANQYTNVIVSGWDVAHKDRISYNASDSVLSHELDSGLGSAEIIQNVSGERTNYILQQQPLSADQAQRIARAAFSQQARRFVTGCGTTSGDSRIRVGTRIVLSGIGVLFSGTYSVTRVQHRYQHNGDSGFTTSFVVERPSIGTAGESSG